MPNLGNPNIENMMLGGITLFQDMTWSLFEATGNIEAYLAYRQVEQIPTNQQEIELSIQQQDTQ